jgi:hypothetical protein
MEKSKNPSNRNSIPSIIISDYDANKIKEIKVKYLKLARLDKITIQDMEIKNNTVKFKRVLLNGIEHTINDNEKIEFDNYAITAFIKPSNKRRDGKISQAKYVVTITDKHLRADEKESRFKSTERELQNDTLLSTYKQISGFDNLTSKDIYQIKRYIEFKNEMMFYFQFIEEFFAPILKEEKLIKNKNKKISKDVNFYSYDIEKNKDKVVKFIPYRLNDDFKNQRLNSYIQETDTIKYDFIKIKNILSEFRHALAHFDFDFIQKFFDNQLDKTRFDINTISLIKILLQQKEEKHYQEKNNYIEDSDTLTIFDEKESGFSKLHNFYTKISQKKPAFNKLINSFLSKDGMPNEEFKRYLATKKLDYFEDIHANKEYKEVYIKHKNLVIEKQKEESQEKPDGQKLKSYNDELQKLKDEMNTLTKQNSLNRLEVKLRLAFGFIAEEYNYNFKNFNEKFTLDVKNEQKIKVFKNSSNEKLKEYFESTFIEKSFFYCG